MASSTCLRRFAITSQALQSTLTLQNSALRPANAALLTAPFSTSSALLAKAATRQPSSKRGKSLKLKKSGSKKGDSKKPAPGERKALRKRVVLSNTNALEVAGLEDLSAENLQKTEIHGKVLGLPGDVVDSLRAVEAFKPKQGWFYFSRPATLMRKETMQLAKLLEDASVAGKSSTTRKIISGEKLGGKSTLLLQGMAMAFMKGWIVINIPDAMELVDGHTSYAPLEGSKPTQYTQPVYISRLLYKISKANEAILTKIPLSKTYDFPIRSTGNLTLNDLVYFGSRNRDLAWAVYEEFWNELSQPGRPPVFFGLDGLAYVLKETKYNGPDMKKIHAHDLLLVKQFLSYLSGTKSLPNGGAVLAALSGSNQPASAALEHAVKCAEMRAAGVPKDEIPIKDPYKSVDERAAESLKSVDVLKVDGLSKQEARSVMEYYAASGMLRSVVNESLVSEKWTLAGGGNIGELERGAVRMRV